MMRNNTVEEGSVFTLQALEWTPPTMDSMLIITVLEPVVCLSRVGNGASLCCILGWEFHVRTPQIEGDHVAGLQEADTRATFSSLLITLS